MYGDEILSLLQENQTKNDNFLALVVQRVNNSIH